MKTPTSALDVKNEDGSEIERATGIQREKKFFFQITHHASLHKQYDYFSTWHFGRLP